MKRKPSPALRERRRQRTRREAEVQAQLQKAIRTEREAALIRNLATNRLQPCILCGSLFWQWQEVLLLGNAYPVHSHCRADWIAGRLAPLDGGQRSG